MNGNPRNSEAVFAGAIEIESGEARAAYLDRACLNDSELRREVEKLVEDHFLAGEFLEQPVGHVLGAVDEPALAERPGTIIGPYKLLQEIGEGGMGTVFMAEQSRPVERKVALKIIKPGMDSRQVSARFEAERQALALMDHPNIARVLDAGTTASGRPYFVMELVKGVPITRYCDDNHLTPKERLELFIPVCHAVQHAHQKGIIHRDLKPSNVLVARYDDQPVPKVIDFGLAKATGPKLTEQTLFTQFGQLVGTLEYMSPEQATLNALDIDTRSDIYSLGVLLYELLSGSTPLEKRRVREAAFDEVLRIIREEEPPAPSTRLAALSRTRLPGGTSVPAGETLPGPAQPSGLPELTLASIAAKRQMVPAKLARLMRGELDWIVMKALDKNRNRRYETASSFAADVQRFLQDEPVHACPPSQWYRFRKLAWRNKRAFATALGLALAVLLAVITLGASNVMIREEQARTQDEKERTEQAKKLAELRADEIRETLERLQTASTLIRHEQTRTKDEKERAEKAQKLAEQRANEIRESLERLKSANALLDQGRWYISALRWDDASAVLKKAVRLRPDHASAWVELGELHTRLGLWDLAAADFARELEVREPEATSRWFQLALMRLHLGDTAGYRQVSGKMRARFSGTSNAMFLTDLVRTSVLGPDPDADLEQMVDLAHQSASSSKDWVLIYVVGVAHYRAGQHEQAVRRLEASLAQAPKEWSARALNYPVLAMAHHRLGQAAEARQALKAAAQALDQWTEEIYQKPGYTHWVNHLGAAAYWPIPWSDWLECRHYYREAKVLIDGVPPADDPRLHVLRGRAFAGLRGHARAEKEYAAALKQLPQDPQIRLEAHRNRGYGYIQFSQWKLAAAEFARAMELQPDEVHLGLFRAVAHLTAGEVDAYRQTCAALIQRFEKTDDRMNACHVLCACGLRQDALPDMGRLLPLVPIAMPVYDCGPTMAGGGLYRAGEYAEAIRCFETSAKNCRPRAASWCFLAMAHHRLGHADEARHALAEANRWVGQANHEALDDLTATRATWGNWHERLECTVLLNEAKNLLQKDPEHGP